MNKSDNKEPSTVSDEFLQELQANLSIGLSSASGTGRLGDIGVHVNVHDVSRQRLIARLVVLVLNDEDHVETRQDRRHEIDVLVALEVVPAAEDRVGRG